MNEFTEHIKLLLCFVMGFLVIFIIAFWLESTRLWLSTLMTVAVLVFIIALLAGGDNETGRTD